MLVLGLLAPAFISGLLMFLAPCTLPMVPGYLAFISGVSNKDITNLETKSFAESQIRKNSVFFVLGFSSVFIILGLTLGLFGSFWGTFRPILLQISGVLIIFFSLAILKVIPESWFQITTRIKNPSWLQVGTPQGSALVGAIFALGWAPCIGPILGTVLVLAGALGTALQGAILLFVFSLGFSIPFIFSAFLYHRSQNFFQRHTGLFKALSITGGVLMFIIGILLVINEWSLFQESAFQVFKFIEYEKIQNLL